MTTRLYLDHAATTPMLPEAVAAMTEELALAGNASSLHTAGRRARRIVEEAREQVAAATAQARRDHNAMALPPLTILDATVRIAAGELAAARASIDALPSSEWGTITENNMMRTMVLTEIAVRTDDRKTLQQVKNDALELYASTSPLVSCGAAYVMARAAWHRDDTHEAVRWLSGQHTRVITPLWLNVFEQLILMSRVASAAGDAGLRARVLESVEVLERERRGAR